MQPFWFINHVSEPLLSGPSVPNIISAEINKAQITQILDYCIVLGFPPNFGFTVSSTTKSLIMQMILLYVISCFGIKEFSALYRLVLKEVIS